MRTPVSEVPCPSKQTLLHVNGVLVLQRLIEPCVPLLHLAARVAALQHHTVRRALAGEAPALGDRLRDGHAGLEPEASRMLHLPVDVEHRCTVDEDRVSAAKFDVIRTVTL